MKKMVGNVFLLSFRKIWVNLVYILLNYTPRSRLILLPSHLWTLLSLPPSLPLSWWLPVHAVLPVCLFFGERAWVDLRAAYFLVFPQCHTPRIQLALSLRSDRLAPDRALYEKERHLPVCARLFLRAFFYVNVSLGFYSHVYLNVKNLNSDLLPSS